MARRPPEERPAWEIDNVGLILLTCLNVLLLTFFIMLSSKGLLDERRYKGAVGSLSGTFRGMSGAGQTIESTRPFTPFTGRITPIESATGQVRNVLSPLILQDKVQVLWSGPKQVISLESTVLFLPDSAELLPQMRPVLARVGKILRDGDYRITIAGHTDDRPPTSKVFPDNWRLSSRRATAVLRFLIEECGVSPLRLSAFGYAGFQPAVPNTSPRNRARNSRIDIVLDETETQRLARERDRRQAVREYEFKGFIFRVFGPRGRD